MKLIHCFGYPTTLDESKDSYKVRYAVRGVVMDANNNIGIIHSNARGYYEIPGGGIESGETIEAGFLREMKEELGCNVEILEELGEIQHIYTDLNHKHVAYCFLAKVTGEKGIQALEADEIDMGMEVCWIPLVAALDFIEESKRLLTGHADYCERDIIILKEAESFLK